MNSNTRTLNSAKNIVWGNIGSFIIFVFQFISRTIFIQTVGIKYLGVNGLLTNILGLMAFAELGIGTTMNFSLYKPVAENNTEKIKSIMLLYKKAYQLVALTITVISLILLPFIPKIVKGAEGIQNIQIFYLLFLFDSVVSYFVTYKYSLIIAEQKNYILTNINTIASFISHIAQILALLFFKSYLYYLIIKIFIHVMQKIYSSIYIDRKYPLLKERNIKKLSKEDYKTISTNIMSLVIHKLGEIGIYQTDNIIISAYINISMVGLVSNYVLIINNIMIFVNIIFNSIISSIGNLIAIENKEKQEEVFRYYNFLAFWIYSFITIAFSLLLQPFITLWIGQDKLIDYYSLMLIVGNNYFLGFRISLNNFKIAGGIFKQDLWIAIVQPLVNLVLSVLLVIKIGLPGVYIGTIVSGLIANMWRPVIVYKVLFHLKARRYYFTLTRYTFITIFIALIFRFIGKFLTNNISVVNFILLFIISVIGINFFLFMFCRKDKEFLYLKNKFYFFLKQRK